jgi:hypothetical protein
VGGEDGRVILVVYTILRVLQLSRETILCSLDLCQRILFVLHMFIVYPLGQHICGSIGAVRGSFAPYLLLTTIFLSLELRLQLLHIAPVEGIF